MTQPIIPNHAPPELAPKRSRGLFGWVLFIALAVLLLLLMNKTNESYTPIALSHLYARLIDASDPFRRLTISGDEILGECRTPQTFPGLAAPVLKFRASIPENVSHDWRFTEWLLVHRGSADVEVERNPNIVTNIIVPLVPWIFIFGFIWFFVFRHLRNNRVQLPILSEILKANRD